MEKEQEKSDAQFWKEEIKRHWKVLVLCIAIIVILSVIAVNVVIWHIQTSPIGAYGTATFDQWSLDWIVRFVIVLILWELLFVGPRSYLSDNPSQLNLQMPYELLPVLHCPWE